MLRRLFRNGEALLPCDNWGNYAKAIAHADRDSHSFISPRNIPDVSRATIRWISSSLASGADYFSLHPLRPGGAPALFSNGDELGIIRMFCGWRRRPSQVHICLYGDSLNFRNIRSSLRRANNITAHIKIPNDLRADKAGDDRMKLGRGRAILHRVGGCAPGEFQGIPDESGHGSPSDKSDSAPGALMRNDATPSASYLAAAVFWKVLAHAMRRILMRMAPVRVELWCLGDGALYRGERECIGDERAA